MKKALLLHFLNLFQSKQLGHDHLVIVMQMLILPMLAHAFQNGQSWEVVDPAIIKTIVDKLLDPPEEVYPAMFYFLHDPSFKSYNSVSVIQLLKLTRVSQCIMSFFCRFLQNMTSLYE
jgi:hypothetical protein